MLLHNGVNPDTNVTIVPQSAIEETTTAHSLVTRKALVSAPYISFTGYGMGWERNSYKGHELVHHSGGIPGISTRVAFLPNDHMGVVILANADAKGKAVLDILYRTIDRVLGLEDSPLLTEAENPERCVR